MYYKKFLSVYTRFNGYNQITNHNLILFLFKFFFYYNLVTTFKEKVPNCELTLCFCNSKECTHELT